VLAVAVVAAAATTACGGGDDDDNSGAAGGAVDRTTTSAGPTTTGSGSGSGSSGIDADLFEGPEATNDGPGGEGCSPGEVDQLPDGWWAGEITAVDGPSIEFDLVCWYDGDAAVAAAAEDGEEANNDYYVRNSNPRTFTETFADRTGPATCVEAGSPETFPCTIDDVLHLYPATYEPVTINGHQASAYPIVWLHITNTAPDYLFLRFTP
jgi:hypothetical protein